MEFDNVVRYQENHGVCSFVCSYMFLELRLSPKLLCFARIVHLSLSAAAEV